MWRGLADWWDSVELWVTQLDLPLQLLLAVVLLLPLCWGGAVLADHLAELAWSGWFRRRRAHAELPEGRDSTS